jgi:hypothetical protein
MVSSVCFCEPDPRDSASSYILKVYLGWAQHRRWTRPCVQMSPRVRDAHGHRTSVSAPVGAVQRALAVLRAPRATLASPCSAVPPCGLQTNTLEAQSGNHVRGRPCLRTDKHHSKTLFFNLLLFVFFGKSLNNPWTMKRSNLPLNYPKPSILPSGRFSTAVRYSNNGFATVI